APKRRREARSAKRGAARLRRGEIVRATIRCLARDGYSGLTMKRIAREAKVSQGILHYCFADKRAILTAALETVTADLDRRVAAAPAPVPRDARAPPLWPVGALPRPPPPGPPSLGRVFRVLGGRVPHP